MVNIAECLRPARCLAVGLRVAAWSGCALLVVVAACAASPTAPTGAELLDYTRTGGFAGVDDHLVIEDDRSAVLTRKAGIAQFVVDQATFARIQADLRSSDFARLSPTYLPVNPCCDQIDHIVRYRGQSVRALDATAPAALKPLLLTLDVLIAATPVRPR